MCTESPRCLCVSLKLWHAKRFPPNQLLGDNLEMERAVLVKGILHSIGLGAGISFLLPRFLRHPVFAKNQVQWGNCPLLVLFRRGINEFVFYYICQRSSIPVMNEIVITIYHPPSLPSTRKVNESIYYWCTYQTLTHSLSASYTAHHPSSFSSSFNNNNMYDYLEAKHIFVRPSVIRLKSSQHFINFKKNLNSFAIIATFFSIFQVWWTQCAPEIWKAHIFWGRGRPIVIIIIGRLLSLVGRNIWCLWHLRWCMWNMEWSIWYLG